MIGGGSTPEQSLDTALLALPCANAERAAAALRRPKADGAGDVPVICRIEKETLLFDLRTVFPREEAELRAALCALPREWVAPR